jgi:hypothetical protein
LGDRFLNAHEIAGIVLGIVAPSILTIAFLLSPFSRRRRLLPWLLAPVVFLASAYFFIVIGVNLGLLEL